MLGGKPEASTPNYPKVFFVTGANTGSGVASQRNCHSQALGFLRLLRFPSKFSEARKAFGTPKYAK
jgi:hypothetical protein